MLKNTWREERQREVAGDDSGEKDGRTVAA